MLKAYIQLTKPGIIFGNLIAVTGGYLLATRGAFDIVSFIITNLGVALIIAGGCVANNLIDRDIDALMQRTKNRASVTGEVSFQNGLIYSLLLSLAGLFLLFFYINPLSSVLGLSGLIIYVGLYSLYFKRHSIHGTFVGSFSGAIPPMIGYVAVINRLDISALLILLMFSIWQMPHAFAIALNRYSDYANANIPVLPHVKGVKRAKRDSLIYCILFLILSVALGLVEPKRVIFTASSLVLGIYWCYLAYKLLKSKGVTSQETSDEVVGQGVVLSQDEQQAAKKMFIFSIVLISLLSGAMAIPF
ncbi:heme o synthase [Thorsellia anophelis]|uniref:Protoheme IX farnesyltransferase n=1 Tax=Thorsellia anophelis DSM 18579 TaxID=1123402 RepID=A0A1I0DEE6_9GAMM|nr:heme o synthase [Thorsellia anophelis]SET30501.1 protoheme IX farnesyltransferase [Thorsellia anophelis DSM 18579]